MKNLIIQFIVLLTLSCCKATKMDACEINEDSISKENKTMIPESFFSKVAVDAIETIDTTNVKYTEHNLEFVGYIYAPIIGYELNKNKKTKFVVILQNDISHKKNDKMSIDSIGINFISIRKCTGSGETEIIYRQRKGELAEFKETDFDYNILADIRKNFLLRIKYTRYQLTKEAQGLPLFVEAYRIY